MVRIIMNILNVRKKNKNNNIVNNEWQHEMSSHQKHKYYETIKIILNQKQLSNI